MFSVVRLDNIGTILPLLQWQLPSLCILWRLMSLCIFLFYLFVIIGLVGLVIDSGSSFFSFIFLPTMFANVFLSGFSPVGGGVCAAKVGLSNAIWFWVAGGGISVAVVGSSVVVWLRVVAGGFGDAVLALLGVTLSESGFLTRPVIGGSLVARSWSVS